MNTIKPTLEQLKSFASERNISPVQAEQWLTMMEGRQWRLANGAAILDWKKALVGFFKYGYKLPEPVKVEKVEETTTTTHTVVHSTWRDPMLLLPSDIERERQRQADWQQYLREKGTPELEAAKNRVLRRLHLLDEAEESVVRPRKV